MKKSSGFSDGADKSDRSDGKSPLRVTSVALTNNPCLQKPAELAASEDDPPTPEEIKDAVEKLYKTKQKESKMAEEKETTPAALEKPYLRNMSSAELAEYCASLPDGCCAPVGTLEMGEPSAPGEKKWFSSVAEALAKETVREPIYSGLPDKDRKGAEWKLRTLPGKQTEESGKPKFSKAVFYTTGTSLPTPFLTTLTPNGRKSNSDADYLQDIAGRERIQKAACGSCRDHKSGGKSNPSDRPSRSIKSEGERHEKRGKAEGTAETVSKSVRTAVKTVRWRSVSTNEKRGILE